MSGADEPKLVGATMAFITFTQSVEKLALMRKIYAGLGHDEAVEILDKCLVDLDQTIAHIHEGMRLGIVKMFIEKGVDLEMLDEWRNQA